jgi:hypothetical protein
MKAHKRLDVTGQTLEVGDLVRVVGIPDLSGMHPESQRSSLRVFRHIVGRYYRIDEFDEYGFAWLYLRIRRGPQRGLHIVAVEPLLLRKRRKRAAERG